MNSQKEQPGECITAIREAESVDDRLSLSSVGNSIVSLEQTDSNCKSKSIKNSRTIRSSSSSSVIVSKRLIYVSGHQMRILVNNVLILIPNNKERKKKKKSQRKIETASDGRKIVTKPIAKKQKQTRGSQSERTRSVRKKKEDDDDSDYNNFMSGNLGKMFGKKS